MTHYPRTVEIAKTITHQESSVSNLSDVYIPEIAKDIIEQISFEARESVYVDSKSGVSARLSISAFENLVSLNNLLLKFLKN